MVQFSINIPSEFLPALDAVVAGDKAGTREQWLRNVVSNILVQYQVQKELAPQVQQRTFELSKLWS